MEEERKYIRRFKLPPMQTQEIPRAPIIPPPKLKLKR
jgi:hypothetical protein